MQQASGPRDQTRVQTSTVAGSAPTTSEPGPSNAVAPGEVVRFDRPNNPPAAAPQKRKRGVDGDDLEGRKGLGRLSTTALIAKLREIHLYRCDVEGLTEGARSWFRDVCTPILGCLKHHHGDSVASSEAKWGTPATSTFKKDRCKGSQGQSCVAEVVVEGQV
jgi:hypothetical protein